MMRQRANRFIVLVAQQQDFERERMAALLAKGNLDVHAARDGAEALRVIAKHAPDIVVTDLALDGASGVDVIREARNARPETRIVLAFGQFSPALLAKAVEFGVDGCVRLPMDPAALRRAVATSARTLERLRRTQASDYSLKQLLDFFPGPALLVNGPRAIHLNHAMTAYLGYADHADMSVVDMGIEDFIVRLGDAPYDHHPTHWIESILNDQLDRDHIVHLENPRHPEGRPNAFSVTYNRFPGSELCLFTFQDVSGLEDERVRLEDEASTDPLTKALNRRSFLRLMGQAAAMEHPFSLIMFDIDHFKSINDTYGHDVGDAVLREISALVRETVRESDTLARWGGEEFMVLCAKSDLPRATRMAERLRQAVADFTFTGVPRQVTSSFGVGMLGSHEQPDELVKRVDSALYRAKESGRNTVVAA